MLGFTRVAKVLAAYQQLNIAMRDSLCFCGLKGSLRATLRLEIC